MDNYGQLIAAEDVALPEPGNEKDSPAEFTTDGSDLLWEYHHSGTLNGVKVAAEAAGLPVDREETLVQAMQLDRKPHSEVLLVGLEGEGSDRYNELLARAYRNEIVIVDETKQFLPESRGFLLWIRYDEISYTLNPRFEFLRTDGI